MSLIACPFCDFVTKGAARSDNVRRHVQRKHPGGGDVAFTDNQGFHMIKPTTEIFLKVKDVNGNEKYGDAFCIDCCSWLGLETRSVRQTNRVARCEEHVCKTKQERRPKTPGAKSSPKAKMDLTDEFTKAGLSKYIEINNTCDFDLATTLSNIQAELTKPTLLETIIRRNPSRWRPISEDIRKKLEDRAKDVADEGDVIDPVTDDDVLVDIACMAFIAENKKLVSTPAKLDSPVVIEHVQ